MPESLRAFGFVAMLLVAGAFALRVDRHFFARHDTLDSLASVPAILEASKPPAVAPAAPDYLQWRILVDGIPQVGDDRNAFVLPRKPFVLELKWRNVSHLRLNASKNPATYESLLSGAPFDENAAPFGNGRGVAEYDFNADRTVELTDEAFHLLLPPDDGTHRCDPEEARYEDDWFVCPRTIDPMAMETAGPIHLSVLAVDEQQHGTIERQRAAAVVTFQLEAY